MGSKTIMVAAWILMLMVIVEASAAAAALTEAVDEMGSPGRLVKGDVPPSGPSPCHNNQPNCPTVPSPSDFSHGMNG